MVVHQPVKNTKLAARKIAIWVRLTYATSTCSARSHDLTHEHPDDRSISCGVCTDSAVWIHYHIEETSPPSTRENWLLNPLAFLTEDALAL